MGIASKLGSVVRQIVYRLAQYTLHRDLRLSFIQLPFSGVGFTTAAAVNLWVCTITRIRISKMASLLAGRRHGSVLILAVLGGLRCPVARSTAAALAHGAASARLRDFEQCQLRRVGFDGLFGITLGRCSTREQSSPAEISAPKAA